MGMKYSALSLEERIQIQLLHDQSWSCQEIASQLKRAACTISRELANKSNTAGQYVAAHAHRAAVRQRACAKSNLRSEIIDCLHRERSKRMPRSRGVARASIIPNLVDIEKRPIEANSREVPGH